MASPVGEGPGLLGLVAFAICQSSHDMVHLVHGHWSEAGSWVIQCLLVLGAISLITRLIESHLREPLRLVKQLFRLINLQAVPEARREGGTSPPWSTSPVRLQITFLSSQDSQSSQNLGDDLKP